MTPGPDLTASDVIPTPKAAPAPLKQRHVNQIVSGKAEPRDQFHKPKQSIATDRPAMALCADANHKSVLGKPAQTNRREHGLLAAALNSSFKFSVSQPNDSPKVLKTEPDMSTTRTQAGLYLQPAVIGKPPVHNKAVKTARGGTITSFPGMPMVIDPIQREASADTENPSSDQEYQEQGPVCGNTPQEAYPTLVDSIRKAFQMKVTAGSPPHLA
jgi:hypothetical protein